MADLDREGMTLEQQHQKALAAMKIMGDQIKAKAAVHKAKTNGNGAAPP
jgi:hypothetical protein